MLLSLTPQRYCFILTLALMICLIKSQQIVEANTEFTMRNSNSIDIQVCAPSVLANERDGVQKSIFNQIKQTLDNTAVYYTRLYSTSTGTVCFLYVFQASSPDMAQNAVIVLLNNNGLLYVQYNEFEISCTIAAVPWQGEAYGPLGPDIPWQWTGSDVLLWGGSTAGALLFCVVGVCCLIKISASKEQQRASKILQMDKNLLNNMIEAAGDIERKRAKSAKQLQRLPPTS
jgi:hypothetical protein